MVSTLITVAQEAVASVTDDFIGVTDEKDGCSMQAYEKARLRVVAYEGDPRFPDGNPEALPYLAWSHDEACASSMDAEVG